MRTIEGFYVKRGLTPNWALFELKKVFYLISLKFEKVIQRHKIIRVQATIYIFLHFQPYYLSPFIHCLFLFYAFYFYFFHISLFFSNSGLILSVPFSRKRKPIRRHDQTIWSAFGARRSEQQQWKCTKPRPADCKSEWRTAPYIIQTKLLSSL